jgi:serine/threonine protein kinase
MAADPNKMQEALRLFKREAQAIARLNHPHILPLYEYDEVEIQGTKVAYISMPFCQGGSLETSGSVNYCWAGLLF